MIKEILSLVNLSQILNFIKPFFTQKHFKMMDMQEVYVSSDWYGRTIHKNLFLITI